MMEERLRGLLARYGQEVALSRDGKDLGTGRAFLQPILERQREGWQSLPTPLGAQRQDRFLLLGAPELPLTEGGGGTVTSRGARYEVQKAHPIQVGERISHWWAVLRPLGPAASPDEGERGAAP